jgi:hypothetical protein
LNRFFLLDASGLSNQGATAGGRQSVSAKTLPGSVFVWFNGIAGVGA